MLISKTLRANEIVHIGRSTPYFVFENIMFFVEKLSSQFGHIINYNLSLFVFTKDIFDKSSNHSQEPPLISNRPASKILKDYLSQILNFARSILEYYVSNYAAKIITLSRYSQGMCSMIQVFLKISQKFTGKHFCWNLRTEACNFIKKEIIGQVFSRGFYEIFENTFFIEHLRWLLLTLRNFLVCKFCE